MPRYLTQEWLDDFAKRTQNELPFQPGASARVQYRVTGAPEGDVDYYWIVADGRVEEAAIGELPDADFALTQAYEDAVLISKGDLEANAAFMQGKMKVSGNVAKMMSLLPLTNSPEFQVLQQAFRPTVQY